MDTRPSLPVTNINESPPQRAVVGVAVLVLGVGAPRLWDAFGWRQGGLYLVGAALGLVLYHASFGFTAAYRRLFVEGRGGGVRAQLVMLALATLIFAPLLAQGSVFGRPIGGALAPFGLSVAAGAFIFGIGMQVANGCASGTLYTVGGGSARMVLTLIGFVTGALIATHHLGWWLSLPRTQALSLAAMVGWIEAAALQIAVFAALIAATVWIERRRHGALERADPGPRRGWRRLLRGPWPLLWGAVALALLNVATLVIAGHPWTIVWGFTLWGGKAALFLGIDVQSWAFWSGRAALERSLFADTVSVMNMGIIIGALLAAGLAGAFAPLRSVPLRSALGAIIGGLMLGYGARLAFGCNIGAFFSGVASGSLHGWLWIVFALAGTWFGIRLRPLFRLSA